MRSYPSKGAPGKEVSSNGGIQEGAESFPSQRPDCTTHRPIVSYSLAVLVGILL